MTRVVDLDVRPASGAPIPATVTGARRRRLWSDGGVLLLVALSVLARLPSTLRPLSSDEGGFLMVAGQWAKGTSLYGDYWVDRPPLLITLFQVAHLAGGGPLGLRLLGDACVATSVLLAAVLARAALGLGGRSPDGSPVAVVAAAATAAVFLVTPLFGSLEVDGEILAVPFALGGIAVAVRASTGTGRDAAWWSLAGALAVAAAAVKQNMLEVFVVAAVLLVARWRRSPAGAARSAASFGAGAAFLTVALLAWAELHGTTPAGLWDAVVTFRLQASSLIVRSAPTTAHARALDVVRAFVAGGALGVLLTALLPRLRRGPGPSGLLLSVTVAVLAWEGVGVVAGGSYWLHYLVGTVPGLVLAAVTATELGRGRRLALGSVLAYAGAVAVAGVVVTTVHPTTVTRADHVAVERYLADHARPGDTGITAFGDPALLEAADLPSPYPELWSLPVRVRDPHLTELARVLAGPARPAWVVVNGVRLATWGVDASQAQPVLEREYRLVHVAGDWHVYHLRVPVISVTR